MLFAEGEIVARSSGTGVALLRMEERNSEERAWGEKIL